MNVKIKFKNVSTISTLILIVIIALSYTLYKAVDNVKYNYTTNYTALKDREWGYIESLINENREKSVLQADQVSEKIKTDLINKYGPNSEKLMNDMKNVSTLKNTPFLQILSSDIQGKYINFDSDNNDMFVVAKWDVTNNKPKKKNIPQGAIISDRSLNCARFGSIRTFDMETSMHYNKQLALDAITKMLNQDNQDMIFWEFLRPDSRTHIKLTTCSEEQLKNVFYKEGIKGLYNYEFLNPSYLNPDSDIFNTYDVDYIGNRVNNYKLIINQGFLLRDIITKYDQIFTKYDDDFYELHNRYSYDAAVYELVGILIIVNLLVIFICLINIQNKLVPED